MKISGIEEILPQCIDYKQIKKSLIKGTRRTVRLNPANEVNNFSYGNNRIIRFNVPCNGFLDLQNTTFNFIAQGTSSLHNNGANVSFTASCDGAGVLTVTAVSSGVLYVGMPITGAGLTVGTQILSFISGTGGVGTYQTNNVNVVGSIAMTGPPSQIAFNNFIECVINRLEIFAGDGNTQIESLHNYNLNATEKVKYMVSRNYSDSIGRSQQGLFVSATINGNNLNVTSALRTQCPKATGYGVNFIASGIFQNDIKYLPLALMSGLSGYSRSMVIEITLEQPYLCMNSSVGSDILDYNLTQAYLNLELIEMPELEMKLMNDVRNGMIMAIPYQTADLWTNQVNSQGEYVISFAEYKEYLQSIRTVFLPQKVNATTSYTHDWVRPDINNYQYKIKDTWYPTLPVQMALSATANQNATQYVELLKVFGMTKDYKNGNITDNQFAVTTDFMIAQTLQTFYNDKTYMMNAGEYWLDGVDTSDSQQVVFRMYLNNAPATTLSIYTFFDFVGALVFDKFKMNVIK